MLCRRLLLFGLPTFSANALLHFDPRQWVTYGSSGHSRNSAYDRESHPLPSAEWVWLDAAFLINMANDAAVDEQGWSYAFCFANRRHWLSQCRWFTFVRRRQWVRARTRVPDREAPEAMSEQQQQQQQQPKLPEPSAASSSSTKPPGPSRPASGGIQQPRPQSMRINSSKYKRLPLSDLDMEHLIAGESSLDVRDPFLRWADIKRHGLDAFPWMAADEGHIQLWKENVVDINYERAMRCLKVARVDRERTQLWKHWLGIDLLHTLPPSFQPEPDGPPLDSPSSAAAASSSSSATSAKSLEPDLEGLPRPDVQDVWDLAEARVREAPLVHPNLFNLTDQRDLFSLLMHSSTTSCWLTSSSPREKTFFRCSRRLTQNHTPATTSEAGTRPVAPFQKPSQPTRKSTGATSKLLTSCLASRSSTIKIGPLSLEFSTFASDARCAATRRMPQPETSR